MSVLPPNFMVSRDFDEKMAFRQIDYPDFALKDHERRMSAYRRRFICIFAAVVLFLALLMAVS
jgi:hypothetical protein